MAAAGDSETGGLHVLDIACGTGDFSIAIAKEMLRRAAGNRDAAQSQEDTDAGDFCVPADIGREKSLAWTCRRGC